LVIDVEVLLVAEEDYAAGGDEEGEVLFCCVGEGREVHAVDFGAGFGVVVEDVGCFC
jgi:hypothetical protein